MSTNYSIIIKCTPNADAANYTSEAWLKAPNIPINIRVQDRGAYFLNLSWDIFGNTSSEYHEITYQKVGDSAKQTINTSANTFYNLTSLSPGSLYTINIVAITLNVRCIQSEPLKASTAPLPPISLTAVPWTTSRINISWSHPDSSIQTYQVKYLTLNNTELNTTCTNSPCTLSPVVPSGQTVTIAVYSVKNEICSAAVTTQSSTKPKIVSSLEGSSKIAGLSLRWTAPENSEQIRYIIYITSWADNQTVFIDTATKTSFTRELDNLTGGIFYEVNIQAKSYFAEGDVYRVNIFTIPQPVSNLQGFAINTTALNISWNLPSRTEFNETIVNILKGVRFKIFDTTQRSQVIPNLIAGNSYNVSVQVISKYNTSSPSPEIIQEFTTKPVKPKIVSVAAEETAIAISLTREIDEGKFDSFVALLQNLPSQNSNDKVYFQGLTPGTRYTFVAYSVSGKEKSEQISVDVFTKPKPPRSLTVTTDQTSIRVEWEHTDPANLDNFTVSLYKLGADAALIKQLSVKEYVVHFPNLEAGVNYNVTVVAVKGDQKSKEEFKENTTVPLPVSRIRVSARGVNSTTVTWDPPLGSSLTGYALTFNYLNLTQLSLSKETLQYRLEGLQAGTNYTLLLYTYTQRPVPDNVRLYSPAVTFNFTTYPDSVAALQKVQATTESISVNWTAPTSVNVDFYQLGILVEEATSRPNEPPQVLPKNVTNATFSNLEPGLTYTIAIRTVKSGSAGQPPQFGQAVRLQTVTKPLPVVSLEVSTLNTTAIGVKWLLNKTSKQNWVQVSYGDKVLRLAALNQSEFNIVLSTLSPGSSYNISVLAIRANESDEESSRETTAKGFTVPMAVHNLNVTSDHSRILVSWLSPAMGSVSSYNIYYKPVLRDTFVGMSTRSTNTTNIRLSDLFPGEKYIVNVSAVSNGLESSHVQGEMATDPDPPRYLLHDKTKTTSTSATVYWSYSPDDSYSERWTIQARDGSFLVKRDVQKVDGQTEYELQLDQLMPGHTYNVSIKSHVLDRESVEIYTNFTTKPVINSVLKEESSTNISFRISYTVTMFDLFDHFLFNISGATSGHPVVKAKTEEPVVEFTNLQAGTKYTVQATTVINNEMSSPIGIEIFTVPNPVPVQLSSTSKTVSLSLGPQVGGAAQYTIVCTSVNNVNCGEKIIPAEATTQPIVFTDLLPFHEYIFRVITKTTNVNNSVKMVTEEYNFKTAEAPPGPVQSFTVTDKDLHSVVLSWEPPQLANGDIKHYIISYNGNLKAGFKYTFKIWAFTIEKGDEDTRDVVMKTAAPAFKLNLDAESSKPESMKDSDKPLVTQNQISFQIQNPFSQENGYIRYYTIIASLEPDAGDPETEFPAWSDVVKNPNIKVYQAVNCTDLFSSDSTCGVVPGSRLRRAVHELDSRVFVLGAEPSTNCNRRQFCNGPLKANTEYSIKVRGYTASGLFQETAYSEKVRTQSSSEGKSALVGGVTAAVLILIILIIIAIILVIKIRNKPQKAVRSPHSSWEQSALSKLSRPVKLVDFPTHVMKMSSDSDFKYAEEYEDLKDVGRDQPCAAAEFPPNRPKNRFTNILPYDHSRVKLLPADDEEGSDYINANYMPGFNSKREYIATQGPLPSTRDDFWRMIWEQNSRNIVMLTRCEEKGREKSDHYWPNDSEPKFYGDLQVHILNETHMPDWTISEFKVAMGDQSRNVRHFHYLVWPDFGVPSNCTSLIRFVRTVREKLIREGGPMVTHCSAGVGRSGTFIVLDHLLQLIREKDEVDIFSLVYKLRKERVLMVQTEQQYKFIHECLLCVLEEREEDITYVNVGQINAAFEDNDTDHGINMDTDDEGINVETS
ncbi:Tyrosine-protein phosphatase 10D [Bulinus truncatus]|nr:Tyrosine-protein phosphatase 10D [Bulinus truncatus]